MNNPLSNFKKLLLGLATDIQLRREGKKIDRRVREHMLQHNILYLREPGVTTQRHLPDRDITVSLTTFGPRVREVATAIESIMEQTMLPNRIVLWLSESMKQEHDMLPQSLCLLERRGLEIRYTHDVGSATKLLPALRAFPDDVIITIDDDMMYDFDMIDRLVTAHRRFPQAVCAGRIDRIIPADDGTGLRLIYDKADDLYLTPSPIMQPMALGVGGVLYPPHSLHTDAFDTELMQRLAPKADDLWFKAMELLAGTPVYPVNESNPSDVLMMQCGHHRQALMLHTANYLGGQDNVQLAAIVKHYPQILQYYTK